MGIKPKGTEYVVVPQDNVQSRWGDWEASLDGAGDTAGEVFAETHAIARSAKSTAELAVERAQGYITAAENATAELTAEIDPEHPDYLLWALANQVDQATQQALRAHSEAISANDIAVQALTRTSALMATVRYGEAYVGEHFVASWNGTTVTIAKRGEWVGEVTVLGTVWTSTGSEEGHTHSYVNHFRRTWLPTDSSGSYLLRIDTDVTILYQVKPGRPESRSIDSPERRTLANGAWETLAQWVVPNDMQVSASGSFVWVNKTYLGDYYARLTLDGVPVTTGQVSSGAPLFGHGPRTHQVSMRLRSASGSAVLRLEARAAHSDSLNRQVRDVNLTMHWVGQDSEVVQITLGPGFEARDQFRAALTARGLNYQTVTEVPFDIALVGAGSLRDMFNGCSALTSVPELDTSQVTDMSYMFNDCSSLTSVPELDTSSVTTMSTMFQRCESLVSVPEMDTSRVTDMSYMFNRCSSLTTVPEMDTSQVTTMRTMFQHCSSLVSVPEMDTSKVTDTAYMFYNCPSLTDGNVRLIGRNPNVTTTSMITGSGLTREPFDMVQITLGTGTESRDQLRAALSDRGLDYQTVTEVPFEIELVGTGTVQEMFDGCAALTTIPPLDTSQVTDMTAMFFGCSSLVSVPDLITSNVEAAASMFYGCSALTDGNVRLIGRHQSVYTSHMITGSGLTREPFFDAAGNPI